jgi:hypothetical protein
MKKNVLVIAGLAVLSTNAFASKARMQALGQGNVSYYISDSRSVFLNPAAINENKNYIVAEWGTAAAATRSEGGFFREQGSFNYGLYLGNNSNAAGSTHGTNYSAQANAADLFIGGDMGMKWGAKFHMASQKDESALTGTVARKNDAMGIGLGVVHGDIEGYANIDLNDKSVGQTTSAAADESKFSGSMQVGGSYKLTGWTLFGDYASSKLEETGQAQGAVTRSTLVVGAGRVHELTNGARLVTDASYSLLTVKDNAGSVKTTRLPVTLGVEADATSWLVLRGSVAQSLTGGRKAADGKVTSTDTNVVAAGASLNFGKLKLDGTVTNENTGELRLDTLMSNVSMSYSF